MSAFTTPNIYLVPDADPQAEVAPVASTTPTEPTAEPIAAPVKAKPKAKRKKRKAAPRVKKADPIKLAASKQAGATETSDPVLLGAMLLSEESVAASGAATGAAATPLSLLREQMVPGRRHFGIRATATQVSMSILPTGSERMLIAFLGTAGAVVVVLGTYAAWYWW